MLNIGDMLQNRYQVTGTIKAGGMGTVYTVLDQRLRITCALKEAIVQTAQERAQFQWEAQLLAALSHPVLPRVIDHFSERGGQFLVMELVPGEDLETLLARQGKPFDLTTLLHWADQVLDALEYLHGQNPPIIHRDIKPGNLKLDGAGRIKLLDFGIAKQHLSGGQTANAAKAYSLEYSPIEQFSANMHTDVRSDIYSFGATLYHLLTNQPPPSAPERLAGRPLPGPQTYNPTCLPALTQAVLRAMALKPEHRIQSSQEFRAIVQHMQAQISQPVHQSPRSQAWLLVSATMLLIATVLGFVLFFKQSNPITAAVPSTVVQAPSVQLTTATLIPSPTDTPTVVPTDTPTVVPTDTPTVVPTDTPRPAVSRITSQPAKPAPVQPPQGDREGVVCVVQNLGGHLYREPSRAQGMALGLIWPGDKVLRFEYLKNPAGKWYHVRVIELARKRGAGGVSVGAEGWARASLISEPIAVASP